MPIKKSGLIIGAILGLVLTVPEISSWFLDFFKNIIPSSWLFLGSFSIPFFSVILFAIIGYLMDIRRVR